MCGCLSGGYRAPPADHEQPSSDRRAIVDSTAMGFVGEPAEVRTSAPCWAVVIHARFLCGAQRLPEALEEPGFVIMG